MPADAAPKGASSRIFRFGAFEFCVQTGELRKHGLRIKLHGQPIAVLAMLLEHPGDVVTREDLQKRLWPADTFVDFEHSLNAAIKRLRAALGGLRRCAAIYRDTRAPWLSVHCAVEPTPGRR